MMFLLQADPNLNQAVDQITKSSIELAQAASDYGALKVIFGIFMVFMILIVGLFIYQVFSLNHKVSDIAKASNKTQSYFEGVSQRTVGSIQASLMVRRNFDVLAQTLKYYIIRIRIENHIDDKERTQEKVRMIVKNEDTEFFNFLNQFLYKDKPLSEVIEDKNTETVINFMIEQIYTPKETFTISGMDQAVTLLMHGIKLEYMSKFS